MFKNILWDIVGKFGSQIVTFGVSIALTRLLSPEEYGIMGMAMVVIAFAHIFLDLGFNRAIIQQSEVSSTQLSTVFYINVAVAILLTLLCFGLASPLALFYNQPLIKPIFRLVSLSFIINGLNLIPSALLYKKMLFKANSLQLIVASIISGTVGIVMAYSGYGVWSLVIQSLLGSLIALFLNFFYIKWYPQMIFSLSSIKPLWSYGSRMFASGVLDTLYTKLDTFIIGKIFSAVSLGYYARAQSMDNLVRQFSANSIIGAIFPYISKHKNEREYLQSLYKKYLHVISFVSIGLSGVLFLVAKHLFAFLFTPKWEFSAELFQIISISGYSWPVSSLMCNIIAGVGNSSAFLKLEVIKKFIVLPVYVFGFLLGLKGFLYCMIILGFISVVLNAFFVAKEINLSVIAQLKIILLYFSLGAFCCLLSFFVYQSVAIQDHLLSIFILGFTFALFYVAASYFAKLDGTDIIDTSLRKIKFAFQ